MPRFFSTTPSPSSAASRTSEGGEFLQSKLNQATRTINRALNKYLPPTTLPPGILHKAMRYSVNAGGKRLRPFLVMTAAELCGGKANQVLPTACALELIHTYSLVHDDLPAMDDDDLRRGKPTNHKVFGEDIAILAGDALLTHAFYLIGLNASIKGISPIAIVDVLKIISENSGWGGMVGGQVADVISDEGRWKKGKLSGFHSPATLLKFIHENKTAALIRASLLAGGRLVTSNPKKLRALDHYGYHIGLAFQITDDILDVIGDKKKLGKKGSDRQNQKLTYTTLFGVNKAQKMAAKHVKSAQIALKTFGKKAEVLHLLAGFVVTRNS